MKKSRQNYYLNGELVEKPFPYDAPIPRDQLAGCGEIWLWRDDGNSRQILLQTRADNKRLWPGYLDVSAAGHIDFGERPIETALRETREELGLVLKSDDLIFLGALPLINTWLGSDRLELHFIYAYRVDGDLKMDFADQEVASAAWHDVDDIERAVQDGSLKLAKADSPLFDFVLPAIRKL